MYCHRSKGSTQQLNISSLHLHQGQEQRRGRGKSHRHRLPYRPNPNNDTLSEKDLQLLRLRKIYKRDATVLSKANNQHSFLRDCQRKNLLPRGLRLRSRCMTPRASLSSVEESYNKILDRAERDLLSTVIDHLEVVQKVTTEELRKTLTEMSKITRVATPSEVINHTRYQSATQRNIKKEDIIRTATAFKKLKNLQARSRPSAATAYSSPLTSQPSQPPTTVTTRNHTKGPTTVTRSTPRPPLRLEPPPTSFPILKPILKSIFSVLSPQSSTAQVPTVQKSNTHTTVTRPARSPSRFEQLTTSTPPAGPPSGYGPPPTSSPNLRSSSLLPQTPQARLRNKGTTRKRVSFHLQEAEEISTSSSSLPGASSSETVTVTFSNSFSDLSVPSPCLPSHPHSATHVSVVNPSPISLPTPPPQTFSPYPPWCAQIGRAHV